MYHVYVLIFIRFLILVEYIKLPKSTKSTKSYASPYLEPLLEPRHPWNKVKDVKFHNMNVRKQMMYNKMKTIQLQKKLEKEVNNDHHTRYTNIEVMVFYYYFDIKIHTDLISIIYLFHNCSFFFLIKSNKL